MLRVRVMRGRHRLRHSKVVRVPVSPPPAKNRPVVAVPTPDEVAHVPAPGQAGEVRLRGVSPLKAGDYFAVGVGPATPYGFLGKVAGTRTSGGDTVLDTRPTTLLDAVPEGRIDGVRTVGTAAARSASRSLRATDCGYTTGATEFKPSLDLTPTVEMHAKWSLTGLQMASIAVGGNLTASAEFSTTTAGFSCSARTTFIKKYLRPITFSVGPVPVVIEPYLHVDGDLKASVERILKTSASLTVQLKGGAEWRRGAGLSPISSFQVGKSFPPPDVDASATVGAHIVPTLDLLLYGAAGPALSLTTGLDFTASPSANPWWSLTSPLDADLTFELPILGLKVPADVQLYRHTFPLAQASGPFPGSAGGGGGAAPGAGAGGGGGPGGSNGSAGGDITATATNFDDSCALRQTGGVLCWGLNSSSGQLGNGSQTNSTTPVPVSGISDATAISAGGGEACALRASGHIMCWGLNSHGQLGNGTTGESMVPVEVSGISDAVAVSVGDFHACALRSGGHVLCWGWNYAGQLGDGSTSESHLPVAVTGLSDATAISAGGGHTCAVRATGAVACWGGDDSGQLGDSTDSSGRNPPPDELTPVMVPGVSGAIAIAAGGEHSCALRSTGEVMCWGDDLNGEVGDGIYGPEEAPTTVRGLSNVLAVSAGDGISCAIEGSGQAFCWGYNGYGELGDGTTTEQRDTPAGVSGMSDARSISNGTFHTCAVRTNGHVACWGDNEDGQLGDGTTTNANVPVPVTGL